MLAAGVGEVAEARRQLRDLLGGVSRRDGLGSPAAEEIRALLYHLDRLDGDRCAPPS
ncbi:hypothetical protein [Micromonospora okii]|uniref:hypothetical protein n=1 Tax=Micromonospora okii TaxID=1182970 RepID=UPI001E58B045|nr:hypothetical protein [Micromonospora okii]